MPKGGFRPGSGRKKGSFNGPKLPIVASPKIITNAVQKYLEKYPYRDPVLLLLRFASDERLPEALRISAACPVSSFSLRSRVVLSRSAQPIIPTISAACYCLPFACRSAPSRAKLCASSGTSRARLPRAPHPRLIFWVGAPSSPGGHLRGAGLDVFAREPVSPHDPLLDLPNVVVTPHLAWLTTETLHRSLSVIAENCRRLAAGEPLLHRVV
jgi:D-isomer specific 2-hydroxyacid dehydrogenase, NAD binding domain